MSEPNEDLVQHLLAQVKFLTTTIQSVVRDNDEQKARIIQLEGAMEELEVSKTPKKKLNQELKLKTNVLYKAVVDGAQMILQDMRARNKSFKKRTLMTPEVRKAVQGLAVEIFDKHRADVESGEYSNQHLNWTLNDLDASIGNVANYKRNYVLDFFQFVYSKYNKSNGAGALDDYIESMSTDS